MLISIEFENFTSFRDKATFSMVAGNQRQHSKRLTFLKPYDMKLLPVASVYGGNASGKTNFFKALQFVQDLVVQSGFLIPDALIPIEPFRLHDKVDAESSFKIELLTGEEVYEFSFALTSRSILTEKLIQIRGTREITLYERKGNEIKFSKELKERDFLQFIFKATRSHQLFLSTSVIQNANHFRTVYDWFRDTLNFVSPDSNFNFTEKFFGTRDEFNRIINKTLLELDTGVARLDGVDVPLESIPLFNQVKEELKKNLREGMAFRIHDNDSKKRYVVTYKEGQFIAQKLVTYHQKADGDFVQFELNQESDGTRRVIDLLPALLNLTFIETSKVYVIDELDRSLHTLLTRRLLESYLNHRSPKSRTQLLFTTHDVLLMDQNLFRRDEMWVTERDTTGNSSLYSFGEFKEVRSDKDLKRSYLQGRLGGIPDLLHEDVLLISK